MSGSRKYGISYKAKLVSRLPFVKNIIIESVEKKKWNWLINILSSSVEITEFKQINTADNKYHYNDIIIGENIEITKEEADALIKETTDKYNNILLFAFDYNIPVYVHIEPNGIDGKSLVTLLTKTNNIVTPVSDMY